MKMGMRQAQPHCFQTQLVVKYYIQIECSRGVFETSSPTETLLDPQQIAHQRGRIQPGFDDHDSIQKIGLFDEPERRIPKKRGELHHMDLTAPLKIVHHPVEAFCNIADIAANAHDSPVPQPL